MNESRPSAAATGARENTLNERIYSDPEGALEVINELAGHAHAAIKRRKRARHKEQKNLKRQKKAARKAAARREQALATLTEGTQKTLPAGRIAAAQALLAQI